MPKTRETKMGMKNLIAAMVVATLALSGCAGDGSVNWDAVGAVTLGIGAAALGAAEVYENIVSPPTVVVVCRGYWRC
jgi:hypothetical protein